MDNFSLFVANVALAFVMAAAFFVAGQARKTEVYWQSWSLANGVIGMAILAFMFEGHLPSLFLVIVPDCLLILGLSLRWKAARQFAGRSAPPNFVLVPLVCAACTLPWILGSYATVYVVINALLACLALASAAEFWRDRQDRLLSRYVLIGIYGMMAMSFVARVIQGASFSEDIPLHLPDDFMLTVHLSMGLLHMATSGAFTLSLAYERDAIQLRRLAMHDPLTELLNRRAFESRVRADLSAEERHGFAIVLFDLDHFKQVNDTYGHAAGDDVLRVCAQVLASSARHQDLVARWGGEEFAALLTDISETDAFQLVERVRETIRDTVIKTHGHELCVTVSAGICHTASGVRTFDHLMLTADEGLYAAKREGRDRVQAKVA